MIDLEKEYRVKFIPKSNGEFSMDFTPINVQVPQIDLIIKNVEDGIVFFDVSDNTTENFLLYVQGYPGTWKYKVWEDSYVTELPLPVGEHSLYIVDTIQGLRSESQSVIVEDEGVLPLPECKDGPVFFGENPIDEVTGEGLRFRFHGEEVWSIYWEVEGVDSGIVHPTSSLVNVVFNKKIPVGRYTFSIQGQSCKSNISRTEFEIKEDQPVSGDFVLEDVPVFQDDTIGANRWSLDTTNMRAGRKRPLVARILKGLSITPISAVEGDKGEWDQYKRWDQRFIIGSDDVNNIVQKGNLTYFLYPRGYKRDKSTNLYDFWRLFPKFKLPKGRMFVLQSGKGKRERYGKDFTPIISDIEAQKMMVERGVTHVTGFNEVSVDNSMKFIGDAMMLEAGYPSDGVTAIDVEDHKRRVLEWTLNFSPKSMFDIWKRVHFSDPSDGNYLGDTSYYMWNFELQWAWPLMNPNHFKEFIALVNEFTEKNYPKLMTAIWRKKGIGLRRFDNAEYDFYDFFMQVYKSRNSNEALSIIRNSYLASSNALSFNEAFIGTKMVQQIGFYQTDFNSKENPVLYLLEYFMNKKVSPLAKVVMTFWTDGEPVNGSDISGQDKVFEFFGIQRQLHHKPRVGNNVMRRLGVWTMALGEGVDFWEIVKWNDEKGEWEITSPIFGQPEGDVLPNTFPYTSLHNIDDFVAGAWSVTENEDIVESSHDWVFVHNSAFKAHSNSFRQDPLIAWKYSEDKSEALCLVDDFSCIEAEGMNHWNVDIDGRIFVVETNFTTPMVVRIKL